MEMKMPTESDGNDDTVQGKRKRVHDEDERDPPVSRGRVNAPAVDDAAAVHLQRGSGSGGDSDPEDGVAIDAARHDHSTALIATAELGAMPDPCQDHPQAMHSVVKQLRHATDSWLGRKDVNEDRHVAVLDQFPGAVFGVFDGHGGTRTVDYLERHLVKSITSSVKQHMGGTRMRDLIKIHEASTEERQRAQALRREADACREQLAQVGTLLQDGQEGDATAVAELTVVRDQLRDALETMDEAMSRISLEEMQRDDALERHWDASEGAIRKAFLEAFQRTDRQVLQQNTTRDGSTAVLVYVIGHKPTRLRIYTVNLGDSRAVLCRNGVGIPLTTDHKPDLIAEKQRIIQAGGFVGVFNGIARVYSAAGAGLAMEPTRTTYLAVSRAFGDRSLKMPTLCVTCEPEIKSFQVQSDDALIILATDGVWDVLSNQDAVDIALRYFADSKAAAEAIVKEAYRRGSQDNITATVVTFAWQQEYVEQILASKNSVSITTARHARKTSAESAVGNHSNGERTAEEDSEEVDMFNL